MRRIYAGLIAAILVSAPACRTAGGQATLRSEPNSEAGSATQPLQPTPATEPVAEEGFEPGLDIALGERAFENEESSIPALAQLMADAVMRNYPEGKRPVRRGAHAKSHGCVKASFTVNDGLPEDLQRGVFAPGKRYDAWVRFSNAKKDPNGDDDKGDVRGVAIKLLGVPGRKILEQDGNLLSQDFMLYTSDHFFIDNPNTYLAFEKRFQDPNWLVAKTAPAVLPVASALSASKISKKRIANPLRTNYWSATAYRLGGGGSSKQAVKYAARPCEGGEQAISGHIKPDDLQKAVSQTLASGDACYDFLVQRRTDIGKEDVEVTTVPWEESRSPFEKVARLVMPRQTVDDPARQAFCEGLSFNPEHALSAHKPLGVLNRMRTAAYRAIANARREANGVSRDEVTLESAP